MLAGPTSRLEIQQRPSNLDSGLCLFAWHIVCAVRGRMGGWEEEQKGLHAGSAFLIILSASFSIYCFAGIMLGQRAGRDGIASLPNLEFWKGLPGLVGTCTCNHARLARAFPLHLHLPLPLLHTGRRTHRHRHTHTHTHIGAQRGSLGRKERPIRLSYLCLPFAVFGESPRL